MIFSVRIMVNATIMILIQSINPIEVVLNIICNCGMYIIRICSSNDRIIPTYKYLLELSELALQLYALNN